MIEKEAAHRLLDHLLEIRETFQEKLLPDEAQKHFLRAKKERLLGLQALLGHAIQEMDNEEKKRPQQAPQGRKIDIAE